MGEAPKLDHDEAIGFVARCVKRAPKLPFIVGVSAPGFAAMRALSHAAMAKGGSAVMIAPPPSLRTDDQIVTYYAQAVEAIGSDIPFVIQDYPLTLSVIMTPNVIRRIITDNPSCVMLKHEDWPGLEKISALRRFEKEGKLRRVSILTGNGGLFLDFEMERGADGAMTGYAFPEMLIDVVRLSNEGRREEAHDLFDAHFRWCATSSSRASASPRAICDDEARHSGFRRAAKAGRRSERDREGRGRLSPCASRAPRQARRCASRLEPFALEFMGRFGASPPPLRGRIKEGGRAPTRLGTAGVRPVRATPHP